MEKIGVGEQNNELTGKIIGAAIDVHRELGPGLLESTYEICLTHELAQRGHKVVRQKELPVQYKNVRIDCAYRIDILVDDQVIVEVKSVEELLPVHEAQLLTYLKLSNRKLGLLINFNVKTLTKGIKRMAY